MTLYQVIRTMFYTTNGIFGGPVNVCAKFIVVFIIFGAFLERTGIANFFISLANAVAGSAPGGPAKVAVISSALCGMVSGSSVGNTVHRLRHHPHDEKTGYRAEFAGAGGGCASTGGQIMPPIMGAAAFLMAEFTGEPYGQIAMRAILPAVLYFHRHLHRGPPGGQEVGPQGHPRSSCPAELQLIRKIYLLAPWCCWWCWCHLPWRIPSGQRHRGHHCGEHPDLILDTCGEAVETGENPKNAFRCYRWRAAPGHHHGRRGLRHRGRHRRLHHGHRPGLQADKRRHRPLRRPRDDRPGADDDLLHHPRHGRADHGQLLHHGDDLRPHPHGPGWA